MSTVADRIEPGTPAYADPDNWTLSDDGTMDTVIECPNGHEIRLSDTSAYRRKDGSFSDKGWASLIQSEGECMECDDAE